MPRSPSNSRSRSPVKRRRSSASAEPENGCPFLIRLFVTKGRHTHVMEFEEGRFPLQDEFTAYGWKISTPSSLIQLLLPSFPGPYRSPLARYSFRHIYVDASPRGLYRHKDLVSFTGRDLMGAVAALSATGANNGMDMELDDGPSRPEEGRGRKIEEKTLEAYGFETGDLLSVALHIPEGRNLKRPTAGGAGHGAPGGPGGPGMGGSGGPGIVSDRNSFGWNNGSNGPRGPGGPGGPSRPPTGNGPTDRTNAWQRGGPLPDQSAARGAPGRNSFGGPGGMGGDVPPGGRWGRGGGMGGGGEGRGGGPGLGIRGGRGGRGRSRSPDYQRGGRRSASPDNKREGSSRRRDD
ncbi:Sin3 associated polypeptide p18-domain-containing protein [Dioszegia hungarica]|uniref:Sin3 associated polypeptide p18-domain-containing protein n=1 Tax=Dioszegia hungarica TaxID=4972 RepID=A0AA38H8Z9_9TREE|nr:Sin3 associated polypeptide p18-domain-containing protein [Dioszegia hungarica]KAI9636355.1 Sin3 associated polypeptide p18-domain-containing protein [Dioszegia hungarica]